jgi:hypothetical protein
MLNPNRIPYLITLYTNSDTLDVSILQDALA